MNKKCGRYESIFIFRETDEFMVHLNSCEECREKHSEMMEIENLVKRAKPAYYRSKNQQKIFAFNKVIAGFAFIVCLSFVSGNYSEFASLQKTLKHSEVSEYINNSIFNQMNLPTDEFGLLDPNKELVNE